MMAIEGKTTHISPTAILESDVGQDGAEGALFAQSTIEQVHESLERFMYENDTTLAEKSVVVLGENGVGKSTLINLLASGVSLFSGYDEMRARPTIAVPHPLEGFSVGHRVTSETSVPHMWVAPDGVAYWDCPGFDDNRSITQQIANAVCIQKIFSVISQSKLLVMVDDTAFQEKRALSLMVLIQHLEQAFSESIETIRPAMSLVVSRASQTRTVAQIQNKILRVIQDFRIEGSQQKLLLSLRNNPMSLFRQPDAALGEVLDTTATRDEVISTLGRIAYAKNVRVNIDMSPHAQELALVSYNMLEISVSERLHRFLEDFKHTCSNPEFPQDQTGLEKRRERLIFSSRELGSLEGIESSPDQVSILIMKCAEIARGCGRSILTRESSQAVERLELMTNLEQVIGRRGRSSLDIAHSMQAQVMSCRTSIERAIAHFSFMIETARADQATKRTMAEAQRTQEESARRRALQERCREAEEALQDTQMSSRKVRFGLETIGLVSQIAFQACDTFRSECKEKKGGRPDWAPTFIDEAHLTVNPEPPEKEVKHESPTLQTRECLLMPPLPDGMRLLSPEEMSIALSRPPCFLVPRESERPMLDGKLKPVAVKFEKYLRLYNTYATAHPVLAEGALKGIVVTGKGAFGMCTGAVAGCAMGSFGGPPGTLAGMAAGGVGGFVVGVEKGIIDEIKGEIVHHAIGNRLDPFVAHGVDFLATQVKKLDSHLDDNNSRFLAAGLIAAGASSIELKSFSEGLAHAATQGVAATTIGRFVENPGRMVRSLARTRASDVLKEAAAAVPGISQNSSLKYAGTMASPPAPPQPPPIPK